MFEGFLEKFLLKYFGEYLKGIDKGNLSVAVWKGEISVKTVDINPEIMRKQNIPLRMIFGKIESLLMRVPWNNLSSKPVEIFIDSICVVLSLEDINSWYSQKSYLDYCVALLEGVKDEVAKKLEEEFEKQEKKATFFEQIFDNLLISVKNIHIRIESNLKQPYCFGVILEDFNLKSVDSQGKPIFIKRESAKDRVTKLVSFKNLSLYHDSKIVCLKDINIIEYFFKQKKFDVHNIITLNLDVIFGLNPFDRETMDTSVPVYQLQTDISNIKLNFETVTIRDMTDLAEYFGNFKQSKFEYLEKQKYNYLKPSVAIRNTKNAAEKKRVIKEWFKFAFKCVRTERRSKLSGMYLFVSNEAVKKKQKDELFSLMTLQHQGKLPKDKEERLNWLMQIFALKDLTEVVKKVSYESFKNDAKNKKKVKDIMFEDINFFSVNELPDHFNYLQFKLTLRTSVMAIKSEQLVMEMASSRTVAEYKARNTGTDIMLNISEVDASITHLSTGHKDIVCLGRSSQEDIIQLAVKKEKLDTMIFGRIKRIYLFYKSEIFSLINKFIDVFEDNFALGNKFSTGTQGYIQASAEDDKSNDIINVKIEAPVVLIPESTRMWIMDLGTFDIRKDSVERNPNKVTLLEGKQTRVFFTAENKSLTNLNGQAQDEALVPKFIQKMSLIVSDLAFSIHIFKTAIKIRDIDKRIPTVNLVCQPLKVDLIPKSMESFFAMLLAFYSDSSRQKEKLEKIRRKAELSVTEELEFNLGYENWDKSEIYIDGMYIHIISKKGKTLGTYQVSEVLDMKLDEGEHFKRLHLTFLRKKIEFRSVDRNKLSSIMSRITSLQALFKEDTPVQQSGGESPDKNSITQAQQAAAFNDDAILGVRFKAMELMVSGYHAEGIGFQIKLDNASYLSKYIDGIEDGDFKLQSLLIQDKEDGQHIITIRQEDQALTYNFRYQEGSIDSQINIKYIESVYKEDYIRSLLRLMEFIFDNIWKQEPSTETAEDAKNKEVSFEPAPVVLSSARSDFKINMNHSKVLIYYKKQLKSVELISKNIEVGMLTDGPKSVLTCDIGDVGLFDLHRYPFREEEYKNNVPLKIPLYQMKKGGYIKMKVVMAEEYTAEIAIKNLVIDWVQQRAMRFIDFLMYQVLEIFYPSLFSFSKYYSRENIIRFSLTVLNEPSFVKQHIVLSNTEMNLCSTTNMDHKLCLAIEKLTIENDRKVIPKIINIDKLNYFPFEGLESDIWSIDLQRIRLNIVDEGEQDEMHVESPDAATRARIAASDYYDLHVEVDFLTKFFELGFLYDIVDDFEDFDKETVEKFNKDFKDTTVRITKTKPSIQQMQEQAKQFIKSEKKERIYVDGKYNIRITSSSLDLYLSNMLINKLYNISSNNLSFDDGKDALFRNTYITSTKGLQIYLDMRIQNFILRVHDFKDTHFELFNMILGDLNMTLDKKSSYVNLIDFTASSLTGTFNPALQVPPQYQQFLRHTDLDVKELAGVFMRESEIRDVHLVSGKIIMTPDYKKDIEVSFLNVRTIAFTFLLRLLPELLALGEYKEHKGYEDPNYSKINIRVKMPMAEVCLVSNRDSCIVISGDINYSIKTDDKTGTHDIKFSDAQIFDCNEQLYLTSSAHKVPKRMISRKFDFGFLMISDIYFNVNYKYSAGNLLMKMTAYNMRTLSSVQAFQSLWDSNMLKYTLMDPKMILPVQYKSKTEFNLSGFSFVYVDNYKTVFLPVLRFDFKLRDFQMKQDQDTEMNVSLEVKANFNNSRTARWEPFLETLHLDLSMKSTATDTKLYLAGGLEGTSEGLYLNFSEELIEVLLHCQNSLSSVMSMQAIPETDDEDAQVYDSQFLIRNKTGYDIFIQTIGDKKGKLTKVKNLTEKFMNFIINDEFSMKESVNRDVILTFGQEVPQHDPIIFSVDKFKQYYNEVNGFPVIITVRKEQLKRVAYISSKILLQNHTSLPLEMMLFSSVGIFDKTILPNNSERYPIVFDKINEIVTFALDTGVSSNIKLQDITKKKTSLKVPLICANEYYNNIVMDISSKGYVLLIDIKPALKISNLCSVPIQFTITGKTFEEAGMIFRAKPIEIYKLDPFKEESVLSITFNDTYSARIELRPILAKDGEQKIVLNDMQGSKKKVYLELVTQKKTNSLIIYSKFNVINETGLELDFATFDPGVSGLSLPMVENGDKTILFQSEKKHSTVVIKATPKTFVDYKGFGVREEPRCSSFFPKNISYNVNQRLTGGMDKDYFEFNMTVVPSVIKLHEKILTKAITITPKQVFINDTPWQLDLIQSQCTLQTSVEANTRWPVLWRTKEKQISFQVIDGDVHYLYTDFFEFDKPSYYELYVTDINHKHKKYLRVKISSMEAVTYFHVSSVKETEVTKKVVNNTPYKLSLKSKAHKTEPTQEVQPGETIFYALNYPNKAGSVMTVQFENERGDPLSIEIDFLVITITPRYLETGHPTKVLRASVKFLGENKVIEIALIDKADIVAKTTNATTMEVRFIFNLIDLSVMCLRKKQPRIELVNLYFSNLCGILEVTDNTTIRFAGSIDHFQIDNTSSYRTSFPVILRDIDDKIRKNVEKKKFLEWNIGMENPSVSTHLYISNLLFVLGNLEAAFEEEYIDLILEFIDGLNSRIFNDKVEKQFDFIKRKYYDMMSLPDNFDFNKRLWEFTQIDRKNHYIYIDNLNLPRIVCLLSYFQDASATLDKDFALVSLIGVAVGGFENARIELKGLHRDNMYQPLDILIEDVKTFYKNQALRTAYSILGSLNIIGNPSQIVREFSGGIENLLDSHGDDSVKVIAEGAGVIAKNTMAGLFGGISNMAGSLAGLASFMTGDREFMKDKAILRRKKAKNVLQGFEQGSRSLIFGFGEGLFGVILTPYHEVREKGMSGLFLGVAKGITGLFTKPASGILDTISKTAEGIQNTAKGSMETVPRARPPRAFYSEDMLVRQYSFDDAVYYQNLANSSHRRDHLLVGFNTLSRKGSQVYLALTDNLVHMIDEDNKTLLFELVNVKRVYIPRPSVITFEYRTIDGHQQLSLDVMEGKLSAEDISDEFSRQISFIMSKN